MHDTCAVKFEAGNLCDFCEGHIGVKNLSEKTVKISLKNGHARNESNDLRLPILSLTDLNDPGGILNLYMDKISPGQKRMYCKEASEEAKIRYRMLGFPQPSMHHLKPLGKDTMRKGMKEIAQRLDLKDWESFGGQALRAHMATKLGNDDSINITEAMAALRHKSVAAHKHYNKTSGISETNRYKALGIIKH